MEIEKLLALSLAKVARIRSLKGGMPLYQTLMLSNIIERAKTHYRKGHRSITQCEEYDEFPHPVAKTVAEAVTPIPAPTPAPIPVQCAEFVLDESDQSDNDTEPFSPSLEAQDTTSQSQHDQSSSTSDIEQIAEVGNDAARKCSVTSINRAADIDNDLPAKVPEAVSSKSDPDESGSERESLVLLRPSTSAATLLATSIGATPRSPPSPLDNDHDNQMDMTSKTISNATNTESEVRDSTRALARLSVASNIQETSLPPQASVPKPSADSRLPDPSASAQLTPRPRRKRHNAPESFSACPDHALDPVDESDNSDGCRGEQEHHRDEQVVPQTGEAATLETHQERRSSRAPRKRRSTKAETNAKTRKVAALDYSSLIKNKTSIIPSCARQSTHSPADSSKESDPTSMTSKDNHMPSENGAPSAGEMSVSAAHPLNGYTNLFSLPESIQTTPGHNMEQSQQPTHVHQQVNSVKAIQSLIANIQAHKTGQPSNVLAVKNDLRPLADSTNQTLLLASQNLGGFCGRVGSEKKCASPPSDSPPTALPSIALLAPAASHISSEEALKNLAVSQTAPVVLDDKVNSEQLVKKLLSNCVVFHVPQRVDNVSHNLAQNLALLNIVRRFRPIILLTK